MTPILIDGAVVEQVETFKFRGVHINKLEWSKHTKTVVKMAQQSLFPSGNNSFYPQAIRLLNRSTNGYPDYLHCVPPPQNPLFTLLLLSVYHICIVNLTINSCTYYLNRADKPVLPHIG